MTRRTSRTTTRHHSTPTRQTFPCPTCSRISVMGDRFCGFCQKPLQAQCPLCGRWTKANHSCCPSCGASLHDDGLSFEERRQLETLQQTSQDLRRAEAASARSLKAAHRGRRQAIMRLLWAGVLIGGILIGTITVITSLVSSLAGMLLLFVGLFLFHRLFLWGLPRVLGHFWRWVAPGDLAAWQRTIEEIEEEQIVRASELSHTEKEIAVLEGLVDPEAEDWHDREEEEDLEDAFALVAEEEDEKDREEEEEEDLEDAGSPEGKDPTGKRLTQLKAVLARGKRAWVAPRFFSKANTHHPGGEDHIQPDASEQPAQSGEEEGEDLLEFEWD